ncbi:MAG TPA: polyprenyl synthetase family protein [Candidatus Saccharimonadales bacterium]|nr:polyprenyl synthetase family protein [Candidatus Saccharimonadales bacterium]
MSSVSLAAIQAPVRPGLDAMNAHLKELRESSVALIRQVGEHVLGGGGKQLRPTLLLLVARLGGRNADRAVLAATAVELIHTATLIHDDSVDGSALRRGRMTVNRAFNNSISILMGDFVYSKAFAMLAEHQLYPLVSVLSRATHRMSIAEMVEMDLKRRVGTTEEQYLEMIEGKTAVLFQAACEIGASLGIGEEQVETFREFGRSVGLAFQIADDLIDIAGDEQVIGKDRGNDLREGKVTLPYIAALRNSSPEERERFTGLLEQPERLNGDLDRVLEWVRRRGGESYSRQQAEAYVGRARALLARFPDSDARRSLFDAAGYVIERAA